jgi:hypothetical protein
MASDCLYKDSLDTKGQIKKEAFSDLSPKSSFVKGFVDL